ncbi:MAG: histone H1 [Bacteroidetes bacterium]|nr:histone H1 [Bacteroidota bacterium]MCA0447759.1 histone H1 [Bacteroidota bacterium]
MAKNRYADVHALLESAQKDFVAFYEKGNKAAGTRVRKSMADLKTLSQDIRKEVQDLKNAEATKAAAVKAKKK